MDPLILAISIVILIFSVIVHEVMHGVVALRFGDPTAKNAGRLTLNPIPHIDPIGTILVPFLFLLPSILTRQSPGFIIGWAKPVPINPYNFSNIKYGELSVSIAGIIANFALAIMAAILFHILPSNFIIQGVLSFTVTINLLLGVFNLLPIPPLDGSKVVMTLLPTNLAIEYQKLERYGLLILLVLWIVPFGNGTLLGAIIGGIVSFLQTLLGF